MGKQAVGSLDEAAEVGNSAVRAADDVDPAADLADDIAEEVGLQMLENELEDENEE